MNRFDDEAVPLYRKRCALSPAGEAETCASLVPWLHAIKFSSSVDAQAILSSSIALVCFALIRMQWDASLVASER